MHTHRLQRWGNINIGVCPGRPGAGSYTPPARTHARIHTYYPLPVMLPFL
jgi:hypothetical protein